MADMEALRLVALRSRCVPDRTRVAVSPGPAHSPVRTPSFSFHRDPISDRVNQDATQVLPSPPSTSAIADVGVVLVSGDQKPPSCVLDLRHVSNLPPMGKKGLPRHRHRRQRRTHGLMKSAARADETKAVSRCALRSWTWVPCVTGHS